MIIDGHCHIGVSIYGQKQSAEALVKQMKVNAVDKAVVFPFTPADLDYRSANNLIAKAVNRYKDKLVGFARVDPRIPKTAVKEIDRAAKSLKLSGVKLHPLEQSFQVNSNLVRPVFKRCAALGIPVFLSAGHPLLSSNIQVDNLAEDIPRLTIIMAHGGQVDGSGLGQFDALNAMKERKNLYAETSGVPETGQDGFFSQVVDTIGPDRLIFGSDSPIMNQELEIIRVTNAKIGEIAKKQVLGENIARILQLY